MKYFGKYWWTMKYFWKFLMGHKKIYYVLLSWFFLVTFVKRLGGSDHKMFKLAINGILKNKTFLKVSAIYLGIWQMLVKIRKRNVDMFWPCCWGFRQRISWQIFLRILYLVDSLSVEIVWIDKLHYFHGEIYFPNNGCHRNWKKGNF